MEDLNNQKSELNPEEKMPKKGFKKKNIIIGSIIVLILIILAIVVGVCTGKVNFTKKSKFYSAISKAKETFTKSLDDMIENTTIKMMDDLKDSDISYKSEITDNIDSFEINGSQLSINQESIDSIKNIVNNAKISMDLKVDQKEKAMEGTVKLGIKDLIDEISANVAYNNNVFSVSLPEFSDKNLGIFKDSLEGTEYAELKQAFDMIENLNVEDSKSLIENMKLSKEERKHFEKVYEGLFKKQIKPNMISAKSGEIKVNGKKKKCTKTIVKLDDSDVRDIINAYIEAFEKDDKGKEIIINKVSKIVEFAGDSLDEESKSKLSRDNIEKTINEGIDELKSSLESMIKFDGDVIVTSYGTIFNTYGIDIGYKEDSNSATVALIFVKDGADIKVDINNNEILTGKFTNKKNKRALKLEVDQSGIKGEVELGIESKSDKQSIYYIKGSAEQNGNKFGNVDLSADVNIKNNTKDEYMADTKVKVDVDVPSFGKLGFSINIAESMKKDDVTVNEINRTNAIDIFSPSSKSELEKYITEITPKITELMVKIQSSDLYKAIENFNKSNSLNNGGFDYNTTDKNNTLTNSIYNNNTINNSMYDYNSTLSNNSVINY